jgi:hypothetical protein
MTGEAREAVFLDRRDIHLKDRVAWSLKSANPKTYRSE